MHRRRSVLGVSLLIVLLTSLFLLGAVVVARRRVLDRTTSAFFTPPGQAEWEGNWTFSERGADPSEDGVEWVTIPFTGTDFALRVRRGDSPPGARMRRDPGCRLGSRAVPTTASIGQPGP